MGSPCGLGACRLSIVFFGIARGGGSCQSRPAFLSYPILSSRTPCRHGASNFNSAQHRSSRGLLPLHPFLPCFLACSTRCIVPFRRPSSVHSLVDLLGAPLMPSPLFLRPRHVPVAKNQTKKDKTRTPQRKKQSTIDPVPSFLSSLTEKCCFSIHTSTFFSQKFHKNEKNQGCRGRGKHGDAPLPVRRGMSMGPPHVRGRRPQLGPGGSPVAAREGMSVGLPHPGRRRGGRGDGPLRVGHEQQLPLLV